MSPIKVARTETPDWVNDSIICAEQHKDHEFFEGSLLGAVKWLADEVKRLNTELLQTAIEENAARKVSESWRRDYDNAVARLDDVNIRYTHLSTKYNESQLDTQRLTALEQSRGRMQPEDHNRGESRWELEVAGDKRTFNIPHPNTFARIYIRNTVRETLDAFISHRLMTTLDTKQP